jgi:integrase
MSQKRYKTAYPGVFYRLARRVGGKGLEKIFYVVWKAHGQTREAKVGAEFRDAMTAARASKIRGEFIEGRRLTPAEKRARAAANMTVAELWASYSQTMINKRSRQSASVDFGRMPPEIANKKPFEITTPMVTRWGKQMQEAGLAAQTRRLSLDLLGRLVRWGVRNGHCEPAPELRIDLPLVDNKTTEVLTDAQMGRLMEALDADPDQLCADAVRVVISTGIRRSALFALEWRDLDFKNGFIVLRGEAAKSGRTEKIPMSAGVQKIFEGLRDSPIRPDGPLVFPTGRGTKRFGLPRGFVRRVRERADLPENFRFLHGLRHNFASRLASSGKVDLYTLQHLLTHESPEMTQRYAYLMDEAMRRAANVVDEIFKKD